MMAVRRRRRVEDELCESQTLRVRRQRAAGIAKRRNPDLFVEMYIITLIF